MGLNLGLWKVLERQKQSLRTYRQEGIANVMLKKRGEGEMRVAAANLPPLENNIANSPATFDIHFLSGDKFWHLTVFCAYSMHLACPGIRVRPVVYDDGALTEYGINNIKRIFPHAQIVTQAEIMSEIDDYLPESRFPTLRRLRYEYFFIRKLTDIHARRAGWKLYLDSDMLFFRSPDELIDWWRAPTKFIHMQDARRCYGYSDSLMEKLAAGKQLPDMLNAGLYAVEREAIDWDKIEDNSKRLLEAEGLQFFFDQAVTALLMADHNGDVVAAEDYLIFPSREEVERPTAVMHHYTAESKVWYFRYGWRHIARRAVKNTGSVV